MNAREQIYNRELSILETWSKRYIDALNDVIKKQEELKDLQDQITDDSTVDTSSSYAVLPNGKKKQIAIENGKTLTKDLPKGTEVHAIGADGTDRTYVITGGSGRTDDPYESFQIVPGKGYAIVGGAGGKVIPIVVENNKVQTDGLPPGTIIRTPGSSQLYEITGGSGGNYTSKPYDPSDDPYYSDAYEPDEDDYPRPEPPDEDDYEEEEDRLPSWAYNPPRTSGEYIIGSDKGKNLYYDMQPGDVVRPGDGSTWRMYHDGTVVIENQGQLGPYL